MTVTTCRNRCAIHAETDYWCGTILGERVEIAATLSVGGVLSPVWLNVTLTALDGGECISSKAEDTPIIDLKLDICTAKRLAWTLDRTRAKSE